MSLFEPGAPLPSARLGALQAVASAGFHSGISMMPLLPYISDTTKSLHQMFAAFKKAGAHYILPANLTLFGHDKADSRTLIFRAIDKYSPHRREQYDRLLGNNDYMPYYYTQSFHKRALALCNQYEISNRIV